MTVMITTAHHGNHLRDYAKGKTDDPRIAIFPESGLSANEQAAFLKNEGDLYDEIITFSPFIISDAPQGCLKILDRNEDCVIHHGDSINKVTINLWRRMTVGDVALSTLNQLKAKLELATSENEIDGIIKIANQELGDSVEKVLFIKTALDIQKILSQPQEANA